jgi:para-nitrobenzyl esterase
MKHIFVISITFLFVFTGFSQCENGRYRDLIFAEYESTEDVEYGSNLLFNGDPETLLMDVYEPANDSETSRPLVIFAHGGFFIAGDKDGTEVKPACIDLARMGYVTASINYRLGFPIQLELEQPMTEAVLRGVHDMKAAVRWFRKDVAENGNTFSINPDEIYIAGVSAGGFIVLQHAYIDDLSELPGVIDFSNPGLAGGIEGESGNEGYSSEVKAIISVAGAISDTTYIESGDVPACLFHGTGDTVVPFDSDILVIAGAFPVTEVDGSNSVDQKLSDLNITHCFEIYEGQGHVPSDGNNAYYDTTLSIMSNFLSHFVCGVELDCEYREILVGVDEKEIAEELLVFPNPSDGSVQILLNQNDGSTQLTLHDTMGKKVAQKISTGQSEWDLNHLEPGYYWLTAISDGIIQNCSLIIR